MAKNKRRQIEPEPTVTSENVETQATPMMITNYDPNCVVTMEMARKCPRCNKQRGRQYSGGDGTVKYYKCQDCSNSSWTARVVIARIVIEYRRVELTHQQGADNVERTADSSAPDRTGQRDGSGPAPANRSADRGSIGGG